MMMRARSLAMWSAIFSLLAGCQTKPTGYDDSQTGSDQALTSDPVSTSTSVAPPSSQTPLSHNLNPSSGELMMVRCGGKSPVISSADLQHWIALSRTKSKGRIYGLIASGEWQQATEQARVLLESSPGDASITLALAAAYALGHHYEMAGYYANQVLKKLPGNSDAQNILGIKSMMQANNQRSEYDDALTAFRRAVDSDSSQVAGALNMGNLQLQLGDAKSAVDSFSIASNRCDRCYEASFGYALASARSGAWSQAQSMFQQILSSDPSRAEAVYELALVYKNGLNDAAKASQLLQSIVSDPRGQFAAYGELKRVANITLRRILSSDHSRGQTVEPSEDTTPEKPDDP